MRRILRYAYSNYGGLVESLAAPPRKDHDSHMATQQVVSRSRGGGEAAAHGRAARVNPCRAAPPGKSPDAAFHFGHNVLNGVGDRDARGGQRFDFRLGGPHAARNDRTGVSHAFAGRGRTA